MRDLIERQGAVPNVPSKANRRWKSCCSKTLYKGRNAVERMFCRLKDYRRIATRYDKLAANFGAIYLPAAVTWRLLVPTLGRYMFKTARQFGVELPAAVAWVTLSKFHRMKTPEAIAPDRCTRPIWVTRR